ncbi:BRCT domain-containing protein Brc1 [Schizosaccharomyces japonicus yFS275]|uniref:BRCT domain-containing protein Brc1 n=1 Tax=Schizosaccharomyces japonicus (strain yFS275 / FY16936) TaxID=402676 RepID=B6K613_SCHJY|nr:BRCT domain-containing protein Brc1 [Schizosaccharomyces japonicus yFS275]EEB08967.1 BRCT domain-containing protein Brc1 [Schizosaccharomyces japonicus yFS275]
MVRRTSTPPNDIFSNVTALNECDEEYTELVTKYQGNVLSYPYDWNRTTHVITENYDSFAAQEGLRRKLHVVKPSWIVDSIKHGNIQNYRYYSCNPRHLFQGVVATACELDPYHSYVIDEALEALGGHYSPSLIQFMTHVFTKDGFGPKCQRVKTRAAEQIKLIHPQWLFDCLRLGVRLDDGPYLFPNPSFSTLPVPNVEPISSHVLEHKQLYISKDLSLSSNAHISLSSFLNRMGCEIKDTVYDCDTFIGFRRETTEYRAAVKSNCVIGTLSWVFSMFSSDAWINPTQNALHYPLPATKFLKGYSISLTNYTGEARVQLEKLIVASGAAYSKNLKPNSSLLIAASACGQKYQASRVWGIPSVSHHWLYSSFQLESAQGYDIYQVSTTNQCQDAIEPCSVKTPEPGLQSSGVQTDDVLVEWHASNPSMDRLTSDKPNMYPSPEQEIEHTTISQELRHSNEYHSVHTVTSTKEKIQSSETIPETEQNEINIGQNINSDNDMRPLPTSVNEPLKKPELSTKTRKSAIMNSVEVVLPQRTDEPLRVIADSKSDEENTPYLHKRKAAESAKEILANVVMPDVLAFEKEKRSRHSVQQHSSTTQLRKKYRVMFTGSSPRTPSNELKLVDIQVTENPAKCTHLVTDKIVRTEKFLCSLPYAPFVVTSAWVVQSILRHSVQDEKPYFLKDELKEKEYGFSLQDSLERARTYGPILFKNFDVYVSPKAVPAGNFSAIRQIAHCNGAASCSLLSSYTKRFSSRVKQGFVLLISTAGEANIWEPFLTSILFEDANECYLRDYDWLISCVLKQKLDLDDKVSPTFLKASESSNNLTKSALQKS